jgi:predicted membrane-bound spermidine synthase
MLRFFVFVAGAVLMSLEILGSRVLAPHYGNSIVVWGSLIGVFLGALSAGYWFGGRLADRIPRAAVIAGLVAAAGIYMIFIPLMAPLAFLLAGDSVRSGSLLAAAALFFLPSLLMGAVSPYAIRLEQAQAERIGRSAGGLYALSTLGSISGTIATAFWLVPLADVPTLIHLLGGILVVTAMALLLASMPRQRFLRLAVPSAVGTVVAVAATIAGVEALGEHSHRAEPGTRVLFEKDTLYHHIRVTENGDVRELHFDNSNQSAIYKSRPLDSPYPFLEPLQLGRVFVPDARDILVIGLGAGVAAHRYLVDLPKARVDAAEIDPEVIDVARRFFYFPPTHPRLRVAAEDGRRFLEKSDRRYDIIVLDAYYKDSVPFHLATSEFYALCQQKLTANGVLVVNVIGTVRGPRNGLFASMYQTIGTAFSERYVFSKFLRFPNLDNRIRNCLIVAGSRTRMSDVQVAAAFDDARARGVSPMILRHRDEYLSREPDLARARTFTDAYAPVDDLINILQQ